MPWIVGGMMAAQVGAGLLQKNKAKKAMRKQRQVEQAARLRMGEAQSGALLELQKMRPLVQKSYGTARGRVGDVAGAARLRATDYGAQMGAQAQQSMASSGLYGSTAQENARREVTGQTQRTLADVDASYAQQMGQLDIGEAQAMGGLAAGRSNLLMQGAQNEFQMAQARMAMEAQYDPTAWLDDLLGMGMYLGGTYLGSKWGGQHGRGGGGGGGGGFNPYGWGTG